MVEAPLIDAENLFRQPGPALIPAFRLNAPVVLLGKTTIYAPAEWFETANLVQTSWWPAWEEWVSRHAGGLVKAREPGGPLQPIEDAPGSYVRARVHTAAGNQGNTHSAKPGLFA